VTLEEIIQSGCAETAHRVEGRHILAIQDTTELNYESHANRVTGLGTVGNGTDKGFFAHPLLVVDAKEEACLGLAHVELWMRQEGPRAHYKTLPIEKKESHRWITTAQTGKKVLQKAAQVTVVADRESDIYELWSRLPDERTHLLIRACHDRLIETEDDKKLFTKMDELPVSGYYELRVPAIANKRTAHTAKMAVRFGDMTICKPQRCKDAHAVNTLILTAIDVCEEPETVIEGEAPIHWRLLTTHQVTDLTKACECIGWYTQRWHIEQLFRTLKKQGLDVESSQLETGDNLTKLCCFALFAAVRIMQLTLARDGNTQRPVSDVFSEPEIECMVHLQSRLEGKTEKQKNPYAQSSLSWASWTIARLGGWKGYASERKPGPITMKNGLKYFSRLFEGWQLHSLQ
jgi:Transposase DDE domain